MCRPKCPISCFSTRATGRFAGTSGPFLVFQSCGSSRHNYCRLLRCTWRPWDRKTLPFLGTSGTGRTSISGAESCRWCYRAHTAWLRSFSITRLKFHTGFCLCPESTGRRPGLLYTCPISAVFQPFIPVWIFSIWRLGSFQLAAPKLDF